MATSLVRGVKGCGESWRGLGQLENERRKKSSTGGKRKAGWRKPFPTQRVHLRNQAARLGRPLFGKQTRREVKLPPAKLG